MDRQRAGAKRAKRRLSSAFHRLFSRPPACCSRPPRATATAAKTPGRGLLGRRQPRLSVQLPGRAYQPVPPASPQAGALTEGAPPFDRAESHEPERADKWDSPMEVRAGLG